MKKITLLATMLGMLLASNVANAAAVTTLVDLGSLSTANIGNTYMAGTNGLTRGTSFIDTYVFDIASDYAFSVGTLVSIDIANLYRIAGLEARFFNSADVLISDAFIFTSTTNNGIRVNSLYLDSPLLPAGNDYKFVVSGTIDGTVGGSYGGVLQATPIPEADSYLLMLAGLGLLGFAARHKLRNRPAVVPA